MENASKALIIAGAILISIVLVSVGVIVVQSLSPDEALSQMDQESIDAFNSKFVSSAGSSVRGTVVKTILSNAITSNGNNEAAKQIAINLDSTITTPTGVSLISNKINGASVTGTIKVNDISLISNQINTSHTYTVTLGYASNGIVNQITLKDNDK